MGGTTGCCNGDRPSQDDDALNTEAQRIMERNQARKSIYHDEEAEPCEALNKKRGSISHIPARKTQSDVKQSSQSDSNESNTADIDTEDYDDRVRLNKDTASRASYDSDGSDYGSITSNSNNSSPANGKKRKKQHRSHQKHRKSKNKLVPALKECIEDFNKSIQSINVFQLLGHHQGDEAAITPTYGQTEILDAHSMGKYFKSKHYNIPWFLLTKRSKFIKIIVNKWPEVKLLAAAKLYEMLQLKISELTPALSTSGLNIYASNSKKKAKATITTTRSPSSPKRNRGSHQENIKFTWQASVNVLRDCDATHFLYVVSLVLKGRNQEILRENAVATRSVDKRRPLFHQFDVLTFLLQTQMDGYLFRGIDERVFEINLQPYVVDGDSDQVDKYALQYTQLLHERIDRFDISKIAKQCSCTIEFTESRSKRWDSVSSLIKTMKVSEYNISFGIDDDDDDEDEHSEIRTTDDMNEVDLPHDIKHLHDEDEKQKEPDLVLNRSMTISKEMDELRSEKDSMPTDDYISKMEMLQQKLADSLKQTPVKIQQNQNTQYGNRMDSNASYNHDQP